MTRHPLQHLNRENADGVIHRRAAFTLVELLLVLAVIGIMTALSWPRLLRTLSQQTLQGNVEQVRQVLDRARVRAVEEGRTLQVRFEPHGRKYVVVPQDPPDADLNPDGSSKSQTTTSFGKTPPQREPFRVYNLAQECTFHVDNALLSGEALSTERLGEPWLVQLQNGHDASEVNWSPAIYYFPDGTATGGSMVVIDRHKRYITLNVRGLTGAVSVSPMAVLSEKLSATGN